MMSDKRLEEMKRMRDEMFLPVGLILPRGDEIKRLAHALKDAIGEIEDLRRQIDAQRNATAALVDLMVDRH